MARQSVFLFLLAFLIAGVSARAADLPVSRQGKALAAIRLGNTRQRSLDEIHELPREEDSCPSCGFTVDIPLVDKLMLRPVPASRERTPGPWRMDAAYRDADFCPYPPRGKVFWQADVIVCPSCGYAAEAARFTDPLSDEAKEWVLTNVRPSIASALDALLGARRNDMSDAEAAAFFNRQEEIPDTVRLEHWVTCLDAMHAPALDRARAAWLSAWALRRESAALPKSAAFSRYAREIRDELAKVKDDGDLHGKIEALQSLLRRKRPTREKAALPGARDMAGRMVLAGLWDRHGFLDEAEQVLQTLYNECRERFLRPEQDPFWAETSQRASRTKRLGDLDRIRAEAEREVMARLELVRSERARLLSAATLLREALRNGAATGNPRAALFYSYMVGEFLRRAGNLPLAAEWLKNLITLAGEDNPIGALAAEQLTCVGIEAADKVNLLSALGQDGELFATLRDICFPAATGKTLKE